MTTYRKQIVIQDPDNLFLSGLPFQPGQRIEVTLTSESSQLPAHIQTLKALLKTNQALPQAQTISEDEITAEITAYRAGQSKSLLTPTS